MVVVDTSVLSPLLKIGKLSLLEKFFKKIVITKEVEKEIKIGKIGADEFEEACKNWIEIKEINSKEIEKLANLEGIENADSSIILLAKDAKDIVLSNDSALITTAKTKNIEYWWLTTFIIKTIKKKIITKKEGKQTLSDLIKSGMRLKNEIYVAILEEIDKIE